MPSINIYCDESRYTNPFEQYFLIGAIYFPREKKEELDNKLKAIRRKFGFFPEMKWGNVTRSKVPYLIQLVDLFFESDMEFRAIVIDKARLQSSTGNNVTELSFYKFYYLLLKGTFKPGSDYYIFLDEKLNSHTSRIGDLKKYLEAYLAGINSNDDPYKRGEYLKQIQVVKSDESLFIQLTDLFIGAIGYYWNGFRGSEAKMLLIQYLLKKLERENLKFSSKLHDKKWNQFVWEPSPSSAEKP
jgi:hypothetical protein